MSPAAEMEHFESPPPPPGVTLEIEHTVEWGRLPGEGLSHYYNFLDYRFHSSEGAVRGRSYRDEPSRVSITGDVRNTSLMRLVARYFADRDFRQIDQLGADGYLPVDPRLYVEERPAR